MARRGPKQLTDAHKRALRDGRHDAQVVARYLDALTAQRLGPGSRLAREAIEDRIAAIGTELADAAPLARLHLVQERLTLTAALGAAALVAELAEREQAFLAVVARVSARQSLGYADWRARGVPAAVLGRAGITRTATAVTR